VVVLDPIPPSYTSDRDTLIELISTSFRMRRKTLVNNLTGWRDATRETIGRAMAAAGIAPTARAETLSLADFDRLVIQLTRGK
jgi:16S rRNA (adenine1518-N6/adenine1519-N6)-dimethyltransferase